MMKDAFLTIVLLGVLLGIPGLSIYYAWNVDAKTDICEERGGVLVRGRAWERWCIDKKVLIKPD